MIAERDSQAGLGEGPEHAATPGLASRFDIVVSEGEHWVEDGEHVLRSTEFDVIAGDPDFERALAKFIDKHEDLWIYLSQVEELTDNENETFLALAPRFVAIHREFERREEERRERLINISFGRVRRLQRGAPFRAWQSSTQAQSSQPSVA